MQTYNLHDCNKERMILAAVPASPAKICRVFAPTKNTRFPSRNAISRLSIPFSRLQRGSKSPLLRCFCANKDDADDPFEAFSVLSPEVPWDSKSIWSTYAVYFFSLHVPLSFGGLSIMAQILHQPVLDPLTTATSALLLQTVETVGFLALLHYTAMLEYKLSSFFLGKLFSERRSWIKASALGTVFLLVLVLLTSSLADRLIGPKDVNNPILKEILLYSPTSKAACFLLYCLITPLLEEIVYRGFLLTSLTSRMKWWHAVIISSCLFSLSHFSGENSVQLFVIGCILGSAYCWSGNMTSSFTIHSVYNAIILLVTIMS